MNLCLWTVSLAVLQVSIAFAHSPNANDRQAELRGSVTPERAWWDVLHYHLAVEFRPDSKSITGTNNIRFEVLDRATKLQLDLQEPLKITQVLLGKDALTFTREGNVYWVEFNHALPTGSRQQIEVHYEGTPKESTNPPWSGGVSWRKDDRDQPFIATTCQGIGASIWWPNKDHGYDEPDEGMQIDITVPAKLTAVSNGRLKSVSENASSNTRTFHWVVTQPINNYCVNANIGNYVHFSDSYKGEFGELAMDYWVLEHQRETARKHFREAPRTIEAFEYWFGKYPFYEDSYKLVVVPYLGMEHQSSVTYGNGFQNGYRGTDLSDTGVGMKFDFIIVHESGHEWFGNNVSMRDVADMWIHESFTNYSENLFVEYHFTAQEAADYVIGCRARIQNDKPIIGQYNLNQEGSSDMYYKGGNMLHTLRHIINDDQKWRGILKGINTTFWHQTVTTEQIETYIAKHAGFDLEKFFDQYLRTTKIPTLKFSYDQSRLSYAFENVVDGFSVPILIHVNGKPVRVTPTTTVQKLQWKESIDSVTLDRNYYMNVKHPDDNVHDTKS